LLPVELFARWFAVMEIQSRVIPAITALAALAAQVDNGLFLPLNPAHHLALTQTLLAVRMNSSNSFSIKVRKRYFLLALAASFVLRF